MSNQDSEETLDFSTAPSAPVDYHLSSPRQYQRDKQHDWVRLCVTLGLLLMLGFTVVWACWESRSWPAHWSQTKEMLSIILPALTGLIGSVIGFYFGSGVNSSNNPGNKNSLDGDK